MLAFLVLTLVCGLAIGLARGGSLKTLGRIQVDQPWLFIGTVAVLAIGRLVDPLHGPAWILAAVAAAVFALLNPRLPGLTLLWVGIALNALVIVVSGGDMPVSAWGAERAGVAIEDIRASDFHTLADHDTSLRLLSDIIPLPLPVMPAVLSLGDVLMASGLGLFGATAPVRARRTFQARRRAERAAASALSASTLSASTAPAASFRSSPVSGRTVPLTKPPTDAPSGPLPPPRPRTRDPED